MEKLKNPVVLSEDLLKFADAFILLSKENHKYSMYILYKYFRSKKTPEKFDILRYILYEKNTNSYLREGIKAVLVDGWKKFIKKDSIEDQKCKNSNRTLIQKGLDFSGEINRKKKERDKANDWWKENKPKDF